MIEVKRVPSWYVKCPRCWRWHASDLNYDGLCDRCSLLLIDTEPYAQHIRVAKEKQKAMTTKDWLEHGRKREAREKL